MKKSDQVNAVAIHMQGVMGMIDDFYNVLVGPGQHELILVVGAGDVVQYASNATRGRGVRMLTDLLGRWSVGLPDTLPGERSLGDTKAFEYLLNSFEKAAQAEKPADHDYAAHRTELLNYVGGLIAEINRLKAS